MKSYQLVKDEKEIKLTSPTKSMSIEDAYLLHKDDYEEFIKLIPMIKEVKLWKPELTDVEKITLSKSDQDKRRQELWKDANATYEKELKAVADAKKRASDL